MFLRLAEYHIDKLHPRIIFVVKIMISVIVAKRPYDSQFVPAAVGIGMEIFLCVRNDNSDDASVLKNPKALGEKTGHFFVVIDMFEKMLAENSFHRVIREWEPLPRVVQAVYALGHEPVEVDPTFPSRAAGAHVDKQIRLSSECKGAIPGSNSHQKHVKFKFQLRDEMVGQDLRNKSP